MKEEVVLFGGKAATLQEILPDAAAPGVIDLLSLDVEGAELEVLKGVDLNSFIFRYICVECRAPERMSAYLSGYGYELLELLSEHDYLFRHTAAAVGLTRNPGSEAGSSS